MGNRDRDNSGPWRRQLLSHFSSRRRMAGFPAKLEQRPQEFLSSSPWHCFVFGLQHCFEGNAWIQPKGYRTFAGASHDDASK